MNSKLLFLCHTLPYPPDGGVWIRSYHTLRTLAQEFEVYALCFERSGRANHDVDEAVLSLGDYTEFIETHPVPQDQSPIRFIADHLRSLVSGRVFTVFKHSSHEYRTDLLRLLRLIDFDIVHVDSLDLSEYLPLLDNLTVSCAHHNVESELLLRRAKFETGFRQWYAKHQAKLQRREESKWCPNIDLNIVVSDRDRETLRQIAPGSRIEVVPNGVDVDYFCPNDTEESKEVLFVGGAGWFPNVDGMEYFCKKILPLIRSSDPSIDVTWVGRLPDDQSRRFLDKYLIDLTGYVDDIRPYLRDAGCFIVPIRVGGGSRLKILDAWAMGKAVVSTPVGCEGLAAEDGHNILIRESPEEFAEATVAILNNDELRTRLGSAGRTTAVEKYSWASIGESMRTIYRNLLTGEDYG